MISETLVAPHPAPLLLRGLLAPPSMAALVGPSLQDHAKRIDASTCGGLY
jgi:hypothetical protein